MNDIAPYRGGRTAMLASAAAGGAGLLLCAILAIFWPRQTAWSYLVAFVYWTGLALASLAMLMIFHAAKTRWMVLLRRVVEIMAATLPALAALFVPIVLALGLLYSWADPHAPHELAHHLESKRFWLNVPFFLARAVLYFGLWVAASELLLRWSLRQDEDGAPRWTVRQRALGAGGLPALGLTLTFAAIDWIMSLQPLWYSTIFGVYFFAGSIVSAFAVLVLIVALDRSTGPLFGGRLTPDHVHSVGKFLLAFVAFWGYIAFSQYMLIWIANLPEEVPFYLIRARGGWLPIALFLALGHFGVPFFALLSRPLKRTPRRLAWVAGWILFVHYVDLYWIVMPALHERGPAPAISDLAAFVGVGGATVAFALWRLRGRPTVPLRDPYLGDSMRYSA